MPIGIQRLNVKKSQPNPNIVFIKPLPGLHEKSSHGFLERIAAQCLPVMRKHHISVMTLEEYEPNREFVGRNFNAGEVIQLVLRSPRTGRWLPFNYVQMVMMHELAHCKQMNHSRAFWAVRNQYAAQMYELWTDGYTGDGLWGRGASLATGEWERNRVTDDEVLPEHLCGGTYRSRRKRKAKRPVLTYQERKERRIERKFGKNGVALGADEEAKAKLEKGKKIQAKPRVAGSARGRELRAAAALARFGQQQKTEEDDLVKDEEDIGSGSEGGDALDFSDDDAKDAVDVDGTTLRDSQGRGMVKVCEDEDAGDPDARNELSQLRDMLSDRIHVKRESPEPGTSSALRNTNMPPAKVNSTLQSPSLLTTEKKEPTKDEKSQLRDVPAVATSRSSPAKHRDATPTTAAATSESQQQSDQQESKPSSSVCSACSFANAPSALTCGVCANVLDPAHTPQSWRCDSATCTSGLYVNSGDCGICGLCGEKRKWF